MTRQSAYLLCLSAVISIAGCRREQPSQSVDTTGADASRSSTTPDPAVVAPSQPVALDDVIERDPRYLVGISFPKGLERYPGLAAQLRQYADAARDELRQAVDGIGEDVPTAPYDLSLAFTIVADTPRIVAVAADGSSYTGGAHGNPLLARFVWLPRQQSALRADDLITDAAGWRALSDYVREHLHAALSQRIDGDDMPPAERSNLMRSALKMIDEGSEPEAENFSQFEPVLGADGRISALRFVFAPYQVGPYSDGVQSVDVPAAILLPHVAPGYRHLFTATG